MVNGSTQTGRNKPYPAVIQAGRVEPRTLPSTTNRNRELYRVKASRLADLFPDELVIQEKTISVIRRELLVSYVETIPVRDIGRVVYVDTPVFAGVEVLGKNTAHDLKIRGLDKSQALKAKEIIEGLLLEDSGVVDVPDWIQPAQKRELLADAGRDPENQDELQGRSSQ